MTAYNLDPAVVFLLGAAVAMAAFAMLLRSRLARRRASASAAQHTQAASVASASQPSLVRLSPREQFNAVASVVVGRMARADVVVRTQNAARERLDATELALRRLVLEMADVMPVTPMRSFDLPRPAQPIPARVDGACRLIVRSPLGLMLLLIL